MAYQKKTIKNRPSSEAENIDKAVPLFDGTSKPPIYTYKRGDDTSLKGEEIKHISVGIQDIDEAVMYYFNEVIKPYVVNEGTTYSVPVIYSEPERWKSAQKDGIFRDKEGRVMFPVIAVKRDSLERNRDITHKIDGNRSNVYQVYSKRYTNKNQYDNFAVLTNRTPIKEFYNVVVPDYYFVNYTCAVYVSFLEDLNKIIESISFRSDSYWGMPNRFLFKATVDSFPVTQQITDGEDRKIFCTFSLKMNGYLTPNNIDKQLATNSFKSRSKAQIIFTLEAVSTDLNNTNLPMNRNVRLAATSFIPEGVTVNSTVNVGSVNPQINAYLSTNITKVANVVNSYNQVTFTGGSFLQPPFNSGIPNTDKTSFSYFINGQYLSVNNIISFDGTTLIIDTVNLGFELSTDDEVIAIGKFA
jgi:hypothetical protein